MSPVAVSGLATSAVAGLPSGAAYALIGVSLVLLYRMGGTVSFTQNAVGAFGAVMFAIWYADGWPLWAALIGGVLIGGAIGAVIGMTMARWFLDKVTMVRSAVTIGISVTMGVVGLWIFGTNSRFFPTLFPAFHITLASVLVPGGTIFAVGLAVVLALLLWIVLKATRVGVQLRALAEHATTADLLGVRVGLLTVVIWALGGGIATLAVVFIAPTSPTDVGDLTLVSASALAAALIGGFRRFGPTVIGGLAIGAIESMVLATPSLADYSSAIVFLIIVVVLLWSQREQVWNEAR
jgi:branched-chain amino acid transport system permease protein